MATTRDFREHVLDLLWSQWRELGVSTTVARRHGEDWIDPEPLIAFTAVHSDLDARLRDESVDWVLRYGSYVSRARLKNVVAGWRALENAQFVEYAATVNAHGRAAWPAGRAKPFAFRPRSRAVLRDLGAPALLSLRVRALCGVGARAELLRALLARPDEARTASELAVETSYGKRNVLNELEPLRLAGMVNTFRATNAERYQIAHTEELAALLRPLPTRFTPWTQVFSALDLILGLLRQSSRQSELLNAVDALRLLEEHKSVFARAGLHPPLWPRGPDAWRRFLTWASDSVSSLVGA